MIIARRKKEGNHKALLDIATEMVSLLLGARLPVGHEIWVSITIKNNPTYFPFSGEINPKRTDYDVQQQTKHQGQNIHAGH
jgi:hypothetical protein